MRTKNNVKELVKEKVTRQDDNSDAIPTPCGRGSGCANKVSYNHRGGVNSSIDSQNPSPQPSPARGEGACHSNNGTSQSLISSNHLTHFTHLTHLRKRVAFTLAEVLVTLAVIGIVAAMTIPNLVQSYKKKEVETKLVKFYSMMNNAIRLAEVDYGPQSTWSDYYETGEHDDDGNTLWQKGDKYDAHVKKYFAPYLKITGSKELRGMDSIYGPQKIYYLSDGSAFGFCLHENRELIFYTENPEKCLNKDNYRNTCQFIFAFIPYSAITSGLYKHNFSNGMQPSLHKWDGTKESLVSGCKGNMYGYCLELIRQNGWKIPEDYPYKF